MIPNISSEYEEQCAVIEFCDIAHIPIFAIPNGGWRNKIEAARMKASGTKAGIPDLFVPIARGQYHGLFIEMKYGKNKPSQAQKEWITLLTENGYFCTVCYSAREAIQIINNYAR